MVAMDPSDWLRITREDGEAVGFLVPLTPDYGNIQPRSVLGHEIGDPCDYYAGEQRLITRDIGELASTWRLLAAPPGLEGQLAILEVSQGESSWPARCAPKPCSQRNKRS